MARKIKFNDFAAGLAACKRAVIVSFVAVVDARLRKTDNPLGPVLKRSHVNGVIGFNYESVVNRQHVREGNEPDFEALPRSWGQRIAGTPLVEHKGRRYLEVKVERVCNHEFIRPDGSVVDPEAVKPFLPARSSNVEHQEVEREVVLRDYALDNLRDYALDNLREFRMDGEQYEIED